MGTLQDALLKLGVADDRQYYESLAADQLKQEAAAASALRSVKEREKRLELLKRSTSPESFRSEARKLLLSSPDLVHEIINIAHARGMHEKKKQGGGRLIANLYQLRQALKQQGLDDEAKHNLVDKLFSKR